MLDEFLTEKIKRTQKNIFMSFIKRVKNMKFITLSGLMYLMCTKGQTDFIFSELL
jgi:hypothetical protein